MPHRISRFCITGCGICPAHRACLPCALRLTRFPVTVPAGGARRGLPQPAPHQSLSFLPAARGSPLSRSCYGSLPRNAHLPSPPSSSFTMSDHPVT
jgi:hypothetical protein